MTKIFWLIIAFFMIGLFSQKANCQTNTSDGKDIFLAEKCDRCHSINSLGISNTGQKDVADLSSIGSDHDAAWLIKFLRREETLNHKPHLKNLKVSGDANVEKLAKWLAALKGK